MREFWIWLTGRPWPKHVDHRGNFWVLGSNWKVYPFGSQHFTVMLPTAPNVFHRTLQRILLGTVYMRYRDPSCSANASNLKVHSEDT